jgi:hypothetical protein
MEKIVCLYSREKGAKNIKTDRQKNQDFLIIFENA